MGERKRELSVCVVVHNIYFIMGHGRTGTDNLFSFQRSGNEDFLGFPLLPYVDVLCGGGVPNFLKRGGGGLGGEWTPHSVQLGNTESKI
jgi:hypothetical protein